MAKSQKRSGREAKKPKTSKKKHETANYLVPQTHAVPKIIPESTPAKH